MTWKRRFGDQASVTLPIDLARARVRAVTLREALMVNPRSRVVACDSHDGEILLTGVPEEFGRLEAFLEGAGSSR